MPTAAPPAPLPTVDELPGLEPDALASLQADVLAEVDAISEMADPTPDDAARIVALADLAEGIRADLARREGEAQQRADDMAAAVARARGTASDAGPDGTPAPDPVADGPDPVDGEPAGSDPAPDPAPADDGAPVDGTVAGSNRLPAKPRKPTLNLSLRNLSKLQDPEAAAALRAPQAELVMTASAGIPGVPNARIESAADLAEAWGARARNMGVTRGAMTPMPVMAVDRPNATKLADGMTLEQVGRILDELTAPAKSRTAMEGLVAAGGWCAPSEIDYSFFDIAGVSGQWQVPTVGIRRGGLQWPFSLGLDQFFALSGAPASGLSTAATMPWRWTETDDQLAVTGNGEKLCLRPECPDFDEERLEAYGLCVLAGNLTEAAYPELIRHFIGLVMVAHERVMNRRALLLAAGHASVDAHGVTEGDVNAATTALLGGADLHAIDMRTKLGMPDTAVLEYVLPSWVIGPVRSDLAKRNGWNDLSVSDAWLADQFDARGIAAQFVEDWQTVPGTTYAAGPMIGRAAGNVTWPSSVQGLMYPAGHYFRGQGFNLNLGVVRDSVLNEKNDHTAAWSEEGMLIGARGNEARLITTDICASGMTGAQATSAPSTCGA